MSDDSPATPKAETPKDDAEPLVYDSADIMKGRKEVQIKHGGGATYRLIHTSAGKLILQK